MLVICQIPREKYRLNEAGEKIICKKKLESQPGFTGFLSILVPYLTRTGPATESTRRARPDLITMILTILAGTYHNRINNLDLYKKLNRY
jgi:hypothetical protein